MAGLQTMKRILGKVQEMRDQRSSLEQQLRDLIQQDDITTSLVTTERADMKVWDLLTVPQIFFRDCIRNLSLHYSFIFAYFSLIETV